MYLQIVCFVQQENLTPYQDRNIANLVVSMNFKTLLAKHFAILVDHNITLNSKDLSLIHNVFFVLLGKLQEIQAVQIVLLVHTLTKEYHAFHVLSGNIATPLEALNA